MIDKDDDEMRAVQEAEIIFAENVLRSDCLVTAIDRAEARQRLSIEDDEAALTALLKEQYEGYALCALLIFGDPCQSEDDVIIAEGTWPVQFGETQQEHVKTTDVYVRLGNGYQRLLPKSVIAKPRLARASEVEQAISDHDAPPVQTSPRLSRWQSWYLQACLCFDVLCAFVVGVLVFGGIVELEARLSLPLFVLTALCAVDFIRALPRLWSATERLG